jgi:hypothetical protein
MQQVNKGPPIWLEDKHGYPLPEGETHVCAVWYMSSGTEVPAKLENVSHVEGLAQIALACAPACVPRLLQVVCGVTHSLPVGRHFLSLCAHVRFAAHLTVQGGRRAPVSVGFAERGSLLPARARAWGVAARD